MVWFYCAELKRVLFLIRFMRGPSPIRPKYKNWVVFDGRSISRRGLWFSRIPAKGHKTNAVMKETRIRPKKTRKKGKKSIFFLDERLIQIGLLCYLSFKSLIEIFFSFFFFNLRMFWLMNTLLVYFLFV